MAIWALSFSFSFLIDHKTLHLCFFFKFIFLFGFVEPKLGRQKRSLTSLVCPVLWKSVVFLCWRSCPWFCFFYMNNKIFGSPTLILPFVSIWMNRIKPVTVVVFFLCFSLFRVVVRLWFSTFLTEVNLGWQVVACQLSGSLTILHLLFQEVSCSNW